MRLQDGMPEILAAPLAPPPWAGKNLTCSIQCHQKVVLIGLKSIIF